MEEWNCGMLEHFASGNLPGPIRLYYCGREQCLPGHSYGTAMRGHYLMHYVTSGKGSFTVNGTTYSLRGGDCFCMYPNTPAHYRADETEPWVYWWIGIDGESIENYLELAGLTAHSPLLSDVGSADVESLFMELLKQMDIGGPAGELRSVGLVLQLLAAFCEDRASARRRDWGDAGIGEHLGQCRYPSSQAADRSNARTKRQRSNSARDHYIRQAVRYIEANYSRPVTVSILAEHVGLERAYFTKLFQQGMSVSPYYFLTQYRIEQALRLLAHTDAPVCSIAASAGFGDPSHFAKAFRRLVGRSPSDMRRHASSDGGSSDAIGPT